MSTSDRPITLKERAYERVPGTRHNRLAHVPGDSVSADEAAEIRKGKAPNLKPVEPETKAPDESAADKVEAPPENPPAASDAGPVPDKPLKKMNRKQLETVAELEKVDISKCETNADIRGAIEKAREAK